MNNQCNVYHIWLRGTAVACAVRDIILTDKSFLKN